MGRKAKDAAQEKIGEWTGVHRNVSKVEKVSKTAAAATTTKPAATLTTKTKTKTNENTNTSNENRSPLQTHSQSELNAMKNCTVRLEKIDFVSKDTQPQQPQQNELVVKQAPVKVKKALVVSAATSAAVTRAKAPAIAKEKPTDAKKVYDYSFDDDFEDAIPLQTGEDDAMKDLFEKLAKENKIEVKKYRPKNVKKQKIADDKPKSAVTKKTATVTRKRPREKQAATNAAAVAAAEQQPPQKRPNLKQKKVTYIDDVVGVIDTQKGVGTGPTANAIVTKDAAKQLVNNNGISAAKKVTILQDIVIKPKDTVNTVNKTAINTNQVNVQPRLRNRLINNFQSSLKSSTPLRTKSSANAKENERSMNSLFFEPVSPLNNSVRPTRGNVLKQRLQLSAINDSVGAEASTSISAAHKNAQENKAPAPQPRDFIDYNDDFDFANNLADEQPQSSKFTELDKENALDRPGPSTSTATNPPQTSTSSSGFVQNRPGHGSERSVMIPPPQQASTSAASSNQSRSANSSARSAASGTTPQNSNNFSNFEMNNTSDYHIFSPTKRRVYGRSPLKNITSEVNNTNSPSLHGFKSPSSMPRNFGALNKSTFNSTSGGQVSVDNKITLPEGSYFTSRRAADDFDRTMNESNLMDDYFGFDDDDEIIDNNNDDTLVEQSKSMASDSTAKSKGLNEIRAKLKRFLQNPDSVVAADGAHKKPKTSVGSAKKRAIRTPIKSPVKRSNRTPIKRNVVFADTAAKQNDIRNAFIAKTTQQNEKRAKAGNTNLDDSITLFEEVVPNQDRRRSYSRPQRQRKRRISIDSEHSEDEVEEEQHSDDDEEMNADGKSKKRAKRRKKTAEHNAKEPEGFDEFARVLNAHFDEIDSFELIVE